MRMPTLLCFCRGILSWIKLRLRLAGDTTLRCLPFLTASGRWVFLLEPQKEPKKVPLLPIAREARPRGPAPLEPQRGGSEEKILKNAGVLHFS